MDTPGDQQVAAELLATNRELVAVNRQIAESLARLERLYAQEVERNAEQRQKLDTMTARIGRSGPGWAFYLPLALFMAILFGMPALMRWLNW